MKKKSVTPSSAHAEALEIIPMMRVVASVRDETGQISCHGDHICTLLDGLEVAPAPKTVAPIAPDVAAELERSDWTPEEALRWYAAGRHYDTVPNGDGTSSARILDNGAVASNALKSLSQEYAKRKGDVALLEKPNATAVPEGFVLVPIEPTQAMLDAVITTMAEALMGSDAEYEYRRDSAAMIAAHQATTETK